MSVKWITKSVFIPPRRKKQSLSWKLNLFRPYFVRSQFRALALNEIVCGLKHTNHSHWIAPTLNENNTTIMCSFSGCGPKQWHAMFWPQVGAIHWRAVISVMACQRTKSLLGFWQLKRSANNIYLCPLLSQELVSRCDVAELRSAV